MRVNWDIFCSVIDNYGDIGVTWRLAKQLVAEHDLNVRLWVDDLHAFARLCPAANTQDTLQIHQGVEIRLWSNDWQTVQAADVVIEAFACQLPLAYIDVMAQRSTPSLWLNLEYLSAEEWVAGCHGLPSMQSKGLKKFFFFPGFTEQTGGLLRESNLIPQRLSFQQDSRAKQLFLQQLGVNISPNSRLMSLFSYENTSLASWLDILASDSQQTHLLVPEGRIIKDLSQWFESKNLVAGDIISKGSLTVQVIAFVSQENYDRLLWSCDFNAVRGEDSFIRAQWAGRPFLWQIYPQDENTHLIKLEAFLQLYLEGLSPAAKSALLAQWQAWNTGGDVSESWQALLIVWPELTEHAENWCQQQASQTNIALALVQFYLNWL